jgi:DNA-binding NarL/FixJ family response regulator
VTGRCRVAICEDEPDYAALLQLLVEAEQDMQCVGVAGDATRGVELCREQRPDVLLLDVTLPDLDGIDALPEVRAASPVTRVLMLTGLDPREVEARTSSSGIEGMVRMGADPQQLIEAIRRAWRSGPTTL